MKKIIYTDQAPNPVGPYNQAILSGNTLYASGQIAIDPKTSELVNSCIEDETRQVLTNLGKVLEAAEMTFEHVVKCSVFVKDMGQYGTINSVYAQFFNEKTAPARALVEVARLPKDVNIEISCIAVK